MKETKTVRRKTKKAKKRKENDRELNHNGWKLKKESKTQNSPLFNFFSFLVFSHD